MTQTRWPPPLHIHHSQNIDKINSFLKIVLNICIIGNLVVGWGKWIIKEGAGILDQIYRLSGGANICGSTIHLRWKPFAETVFHYKPLIFFVKSSNLDGSITHLQETLLMICWWSFLILKKKTKKNT